jgi:hypothetical protein
VWLSEYIYPTSESKGWISIKLHTPRHALTNHGVLCLCSFILKNALKEGILKDPNLSKIGFEKKRQVN